MEITWQKSSFSTDSEGNCLEIAEVGDEILLRESDNGNVIVRTSREKLRAFLLGAQANEFDHFVK
ncbi:MULTISPECIES: DUF397 domain-containing protein [unclassified Streptomyces]|uniref:DUF397 domain-containing protein n=1 Tax=unclassified Streptomyces TaxID=2593676 RepID=UPI0006AF5EA2|nr:DUF397 domain-containing protein [Streptomyces sp. WM6378]KOU40140.1 hypothetical protein ADK54_23350 [Streptomyces sp. WM6378]